MRKSKKQLLRALIACGLVASVAAGGTVAYLTDAETATNTFTIGRVRSTWKNLVIRAMTVMRSKHRPKPGDREGSADREHRQ